MSSCGVKGDGKEPSQARCCAVHKNQAERMGQGAAVFVRFFLIFRILKLFSLLEKLSEPNAPAHHEPPNCEFRLYSELQPGGDAVARTVSRGLLTD